MSKKLLVVVDYQEDFVNSKKGSLGFPKAETLENGIYNKVQDYIANGDKVLFTFDTHFEDYLSTREGKNLPVKHCILGGEGHKLYGRLNDIGFDGTNIMSCFKEDMFGYPVHYKLKDSLSDVEEIELVGVVTNICVISNAVTFQSAFPQASIIVDASLCASFNEELHEKALDVMEGMQVKVINR